MISHAHHGIATVVGIIAVARAGDDMLPTFGRSDREVTAREVDPGLR